MAERSDKLLMTGVGPLIAPASKLIAQMVKLQDEMELPIGLVLKGSGSKLPTTHLIDSIKSLRQMKVARVLLPRLVKKEVRLRKRFSIGDNKKHGQTLQTKAERRIF